MGAEKNKPSKKELLLELENIRDLLGEASPVSDSSVPPPENPSLEFPDGEGYLASIPKLTKKVNIDKPGEPQQAAKTTESAQPAPETRSANAAANKATSESTVATPGDNAAIDSVSPPPKASGHPPAAAKEKKADNPFLPPHIREHLDQRKQQALVEELNQLGESLERSRKQIPRPKPPDTNAGNAESQPSQGARLSRVEVEDMLDELVQKYLPKIEKELKQRLRAKLQFDTSGDD